MEVKAKIGISNRHVHLSQEDYNILFDEPLNVQNYIHQKGEFASDKMVTLVNGDKEINNVRVVGPIRSYTQVEISHKDALTLQLDPPVRASGDLEGASSITIKTEKGSITRNACIIAQRHLHLTKEEALEYGVSNGQRVYIAIRKERGGMMEAFVKITDNAYTEVHVDTDEANAFSLNNDDEVDVII